MSEQTMTLANTHLYREGMVVTFPDGTRRRIERVISATAFTLGPLVLTRRQRLWRYLTTAPKGDATQWMTREYRS